MWERITLQAANQGAWIFETEESINRSTIFEQSSIRRPTLYRYEMGGVVIYDIYSRLVGSTEQTPTQSARPNLTKDEQKLFDSGSAQDKILYNEMTQYGNSRHYSPLYTIQIPTDENILVFDSRFESGNLRKVIYCEDNYKLFMEPDTNSKTYTQWYFFSVSNNKIVEANFQIMNFCKSTSLYQSGMKPLVWSSRMYFKKGIGWHRSGKQITYSQSDQGNYQLNFTYKFKYDNDKVFFAYSHPYTYNKLQKLLEKCQQFSEIARVSILCKSLGGNDCNLITITNDISTYCSEKVQQLEMRLSSGARKLMHKNQKMLRKHKVKKAVIITSRVHSGESISSWVMDGIIKFLISDSQEAFKLREKFVFQLIPMLNPDGVRYGNYRCSLLGVDLNRR